MNIEMSHEDLEIISWYITEADNYGLVPEVVLFALNYMKQHSETSVIDAINYGYNEWIK